MMRRLLPILAHNLELFGGSIFGTTSPRVCQHQADTLGCAALLSIVYQVFIITRFETLLYACFFISLIIFLH